MRRILIAASAAALFAASFVAGSSAQDTGSAADAAPPAARAVRDPLTISALEKMGAALRNLKSFEVRADTTEERVLTTGQKIQYAGYSEIKGLLPNRLRVDRFSDRQHRSLYFDGSALTIYSPRVGFYGTVPVSGSIREVTATVAESYDIETPLADLFAWGEDPAVAAKLTSAFYVGAETVDGVACEQYAMRQAEVDWQVWIRQKGEALPCKIVVTSTTDPSMPQYSAVYSWASKKTHPANTFTFVPPKGSKQIPLEKTSSALAAAPSAGSN